ncbi:MAG: DUF2062 domain-containing protein [Chthoniobacterales bacterium]
MSMMRLRRSRLRGWLKKIPRRRHVEGTWLHHLLGDRVFSPELWRPSRKTTAAGVANGFFWAMMPIPFQMLPSGITAFLFRFNMPAAISVVWVTNPITWPVILYWQYRLGAWLVRGEAPKVESLKDMLAMFGHVPLPLLLGCLVTGVIIAPLSYVAVLFLWPTVAERWWQSHAHPAAKLAPKL